MRTFTAPPTEDGENDKMKAKDVIIIVLLVISCGLSAVNFAILAKNGLLSGSFDSVTESVTPAYSQHTTVVFANSTDVSETNIDRSIPLDADTAGDGQTAPVSETVYDNPLQIVTDAPTEPITVPDAPTTVVIVPPPVTAPPVTAPPVIYPSAAPVTEPQFPININTATAEQLMLLNGIGEKKAQAIIEYRENNGPFEKIDDILKVSGIGDKTFQNIREFITV